MIPIFYHDIVTPSGHPGDEVISALQKFIRRGETELAVRAAYELYLTGEELTAYLWRRLLVISAEDVGLGEPMAPVVVDALHRSSRELSRDSSDYQLLFVHAVRYLCACRKERGSSVLASVVKRRIRRGDPFPLPDYVYDMHTLTGQERGRNIDHFLAEAACVRPGVRATAEELEEQRKKVFDAPVKFSIVIPAFKTPERFLREMLDSIAEQTYANWEVCVADGSPAGQSCERVLEQYAKKDSRFKYVILGENKGISGNTNAAMDMATGDYIVLADHDDKLTPNALYECAKLLQEHPGCDCFYSDEDKLDIHYGEEDIVDVYAKFSKSIMESIIDGHMTFQRAFMTGEMTAKGNFKTLRMLDQIFPF